MSDTPETDHAAFVLKDWRESYDVVLVSFAEQLERERDELRAGLLTMISAANAVVERWETPLWKDSKPTATFIHGLRDAVDKMKVIIP